jgi:hypothetical protein
MTAKGVYGDVSATACNVSHDLRDVNVALCENRHFRADAFGELEALRADVYRNHAGADRLCDHHRGKADTAATVDDQPFAG